MRKAYQLMIRAYGGGPAAMAAALGRTEAALNNRLFELQGQSINVNDALAMQAISKTTYFAQAVAEKSGGVFLELPEHGEVCNEDLLKKFNQLHAHIGELNAEFTAATEDDEIDEKERAKLKAIGHKINKATHELLTIANMVYGVDK